MKSLVLVILILDHYPNIMNSQLSNRSTKNEINKSTHYIEDWFDQSNEQSTDQSHDESLDQSELIVSKNQSFDEHKIYDPKGVPFRNVVIDLITQYQNKGLAITMKILFLKLIRINSQNGEFPNLSFAGLTRFVDKLSRLGIVEYIYLDHSYGLRLRK